MCIFCTFVFLSSCSLVPDDLFASKQPQPTKKPIDRWVNNTKTWQTWDVNDPNNEFATWSRAEDAFEIRFTASPELNSYSQRAHTLSVKVIQLTEVSGLNTLLQTSEGIGQVLSQPLEMIPNAVFSQSYTLAPKQVMSDKFAREENVKFIAVVAGFAELNKIQVVRIIPISVKSIPQKPIEAEWTLYDQVTLGYFVEKELQPDVVRPANIKMNIRLGESSITKFSATAR